MNIQITSRKFRAKDSLKSFIEKEIESLEKYHGDIIDANIVLSFTHLKDSIKTAEISLRVPGKSISASGTSDEFRVSVSNAAQKIQRKLRQIKDKKVKR